MATRSADIVVDSFAWVEYFRGSSLGEEVERLLRSRRCATPTIVLAELSDKYYRDGIQGLSTDLDEVDALSSLITLDRELAEAAGRIKVEARKTMKDFPLSDGIVYATAESLGAEVLTGDPHFRGRSRVIFLA